MAMPFDRTVERWFREHVGEPTEIQRLAWPRIAAGAHVLVAAPTGSGKTLAAFLYALDRLLTGAWDGGSVRVLYVSPMRALNTDVRLNLLAPLAGLRRAFEDEGRTPAPVSILTRSGDTPQPERQRMARRPPEILITTPESLAILLTARGGRRMLAGVRTVVLDEVHAVAGNKRGALLALSLERVAALAGEVQRVALSATVTPLGAVAEWVGGAGREVEPIVSRAPKRYALTVTFPPAAPAPAGPSPAETGDGVWPAVVADLKRRIAAGRSSLVFANSRRMVEKLTRLINEHEPREIAWAHHGSLSREVRRVVEERLKAGALQAIVATNSLELGIDVGALDEVLLVQAPPSLASAVQRVGRAGHGVGEVSRARLVALAPRDLLEAAVCARAVADGEIEPIVPLAAPLDVLAQALVSLTATESVAADELYALVTRAAPYRDLSRRVFDLVLDALAGRYADARVPELRPLVSLDRVEGTVRGRPGAERLVYMAGGTIPDRGLYRLRRADSGALIGELDEEFVWERSIGDAFTLGVQTWRIERITHNDVLVVPAVKQAALAPFWRADGRNRGHLYGMRVAALLERAAQALDDPGFAGELAARFFLEAPAAEALVGWLREQREQLGGFLPHARQVVAERALDPGGGEGWLVLHTSWGGRVNQPLAFALAAAWEERGRGPLHVEHDDFCVVAALPAAARARELIDLVDPENVDRLVRAGLGRTGLFGARFREAAGIALLLPRQGFNRRTPLWFTRQKAKDLLAAVARRPEFPVTVEAWRACLADEFELDELRARLADLRDGTIALAEVETLEPSGFAGGVVWKRTNELMYADDAPGGAGVSAHAGLLAEVARSPHLRPRLEPALVAALRARLQRTAPGYAPRTPEDLVDWVGERALLTRAEWDALAAAIERDHEVSVDELLAALPGRIEVGAREVHAVEEGARLAAARAADDAALPALAELCAARLRCDGPVPLTRLAADTGVELDRVAAALALLADEDRVVVDLLTLDAVEPEACDAENLERLLRAARSAARGAPAFAARPFAELAPFLAFWQQAARLDEGPGALREALAPLFGCALPAELWETDVLPARVRDYRPEQLEALLLDSDLTWIGCGPERIAFALRDELALFREDGPAAPDEDAGEDLFPGGKGAFTLEELAARTGLPSAELAARLWSLAWRGLVTTDAFAPLRRGIETGFTAAEPAAAPIAMPVRGARLRFARWQGTRPFGGAWRRTPALEPALDAVEEDARARERARVLLDRYGVVFRDLAARELGPLQWPRVFRALRLLELAGEAVGGQFFEGARGLQFAAPAALRALQEGAYRGHAFWLNAADPASPAGLAPLEGTSPWPRRVPSTLLGFRGTELVFVAERRGRRLTFADTPDDLLLSTTLAPLAEQLSRPVRPLRSIVCEEINGEPAASSPYRAALELLFAVERDVTALRLARRY